MKILILSKQKTEKMNESIGIIPIGLSMQDLSNQKQDNFSDKVRKWLISNNYHLLNPTPFLSTRNNEPLSPPNSDEDSIPAPLSDLALSGSSDLDEVKEAQEAQTAAGSAELTVIKQVGRDRGHPDPVSCSEGPRYKSHFVSITLGIIHILRNAWWGYGGLQKVPKCVTNAK